MRCVGETRLTKKKPNKGEGGEGGEGGGGADRREPMWVAYTSFPQLTEFPLSIIFVIIVLAEDAF